MMDTAGPAPLQQPGALEHGDVPRNSRQRHGERPRKVRHARVPAGQPLEYLPPCRVRKRAERAIERGRTMLNHTVNYSASRVDCKCKAPARAAGAESLAT